MNPMEVTLLILGVIIFLASFIIKDKESESQIVDEEQQTYLKISYGELLKHFVKDEKTYNKLKEVIKMRENCVLKQMREVSDRYIDSELERRMPEVMEKAEKEIEKRKQEIIEKAKQETIEKTKQELEKANQETIEKTKGEQW